jgi:hypothetical protein
VSGWGDGSAEVYPSWLDPGGRDYDAESSVSWQVISENARAMGTKVIFGGGGGRVATMSWFLSDTSPTAVGGTRVLRRHVQW